ncbi:hypothetical protein GCM10010094_76530 [Streptomyces flaveus]|uniref:Uncharacterized protein n=1 Tax=Streptomyces flaveus TaxID=66370 RepID=A0A917REZ0_9ACTN|nr:hypothetical protein GCM10010094_76530 [Streptomyces flaveus]
MQYIAFCMLVGNTGAGGGGLSRGPASTYRLTFGGSDEEHQMAQGAHIERDPAGGKEIIANRALEILGHPLRPRHHRQPRAPPRHRPPPRRTVEVQVSRQPLLPNAGAGQADPINRIGLSIFMLRWRQ